MAIRLEAACGCNIGKIRKNNEDNFCFDGNCLEQENNGLPNTASFGGKLKHGTYVAVFDGMGGENYGEVASYTAAHAMRRTTKKLADHFISPKKYVEKMAFFLNDSVVEAKRELCTNRMGTTMVMLFFTFRHVYMCNIGDSRAYRLRDGQLLQISQDHVEHYPGKRKTPLTQHLGIEPEDLLIEPYITRVDLRKGDQYLLCSDGLTDMLNDLEISDIMKNSVNAVSCTEKLVSAALEHGGRDNITAILCRIL